MAETTQVLILLCTFLFILLSAILLKLKLRTTTTTKQNTNLPPGPRALPVIGNIHCLLGSLPHHAMEKLSRRYGPVMFLRLGQIQTLVLSSPEAARELMKTHDVAFATRPVTPTASILSYGARDITFAPFGKHYRELRKLCTLELLSPKRVRSFRHVREEESARLVRSVAAAASSSSSQVVNVSELVKIATNDIVMRAIIGDRCPQKVREAYLEAVDKAMDILFAGLNLADLFPDSRLARVLGGRSLRAAKQVHEKLHRITDTIIQGHGIKNGAIIGDDDKERRDGGDHDECENILDVLLRCQRDGGLGITLTKEIVSAVLFDLFTAGSETTSTIIAWAMSELMRSPHVMERVQSEIRQVLQGKTIVNEVDIKGHLHYLQLVIKETLRLHWPFLLPRLCSEPNSKIMGYDIPQGTTVLVNLSAICKDENNWKDANEFRPERFKDDIVDFNGTDFRFIPGGSGRRMCPGLLFGVSSLEIELASLLYHFDWELPNETATYELDMTETHGLTGRRRTDLLLKAIPFCT